MECQSGARPGAAPAGFSAADISALPPGSVGQGSLVTEDHREVGPLSRGVMLPPAQPLSGPLPAGLRLLPDPLPAAPSVPLRATFPRGGATGLPRCVALAVWVRSRLSAGDATAAPGEFGAPGPDHVPFGPSASAAYACPRDDV